MNWVLDNANPVNVSEGKPTYCSLRFPGEALRAVGVDFLTDFYAALVNREVRVNCTRFDVAFDTQTFTVQDVVDARKAGVLACRAQVFREITEDQGGERTGHTLYFGARQSEAMLRVYYKTDGYSFGVDAFTRVELELKGNRASFHFQELMAAPMKEWAQLAGGWLKAFIQIGRDWWESFVQSFYAFWLRVCRAPETLEKMGEWLRRQVAPTLACYITAKSGGDVSEMFDIFRRLSEQGLKRMDKLKEAIARDAGADVPDILDFFEALAIES